ncbi:thiamine pyrophosphate-binding protein [Miltoncostaea marina]|uniref:thiamine pyrophosphate-binding protein n=1 Tax=Miltoncostaea marina TaxID=2843215 RepID=UPI001C3D7FC8|nr:thiamine pyrophosphate-binding protein [Miltoncostaea marina]
MNGADWLLDALRAEGVGVLFGNPGSTELPITDALGRRPEVRYVLGLHEAVVMGMADGHAQATGRPSVVNVHVQPGLANAMSGILNAARARVPVVVTVGQQVQEMLPGDPFLGGELVAMAAPIAKGAWEVASARELPEAFARALATAAAPPAGPTVLSLPLDVQVAPAPAPHEPRPAPRAAPPPAEALDAAAAVLAAARSPVVAAGDEVVAAGASAELAALADRLGAPLFGEPMGARVPLPTDHPLWRGPLPPFAAQIAPLLAHHDALLAVGMPVFRLFGTSPGPAIGPGTALVHADVDAREVGKVHPPAAGVVGDVRASLAGLLERLGPAGPSDAARRGRAVAATLAARRAARARQAREAAGARVGPAALARAIASAAGPRDLVVDEALTAGRGLRTALSRRTPATWLAHRGSALGWGLPAAVGAGLADPGRRVMAVQGDGGLLFGVSALWTAAAEGVGTALVVADNGGYEILRAGLEGLTGRPEGDWPGIRLRRPRLDIASICAGFGASAARVDAPGDLREALADLWRRTADGPAVLVVGVEGRTAPVGYPVAPAG